MNKNKLNVRNAISRAGYLGLVSAVALGATPSFAQKYTATEMKTLSGGTVAVATAMNNLDQVVGFADTETGWPDAVKWNGGNPTVIFSQPGNTGFLGSAGATAINDSGVVLGSYFPLYNEVDLLFVWSPKFLNENLTSPYDYDSESLRGINNSGEIVGTTAATNGYGSSAEVWANPQVTGGPTALLIMPDGYNGCSTGDAINNAGVLAGSYCLTNSKGDEIVHAVRWTSSDAVGTDLGTLPGGENSQVTGINDAGYIVGSASLANNFQHAVIWGPKTRAVDLGTLGGHNSYATAINTEGDVAGSAQTIYGVWHATLWTHKHFTPIDLNREIDPNLAKQVTLSDAIATNEKCRVLVTGTNNKTGLAVSYVLFLTEQANCNY